ncbi:hypothetical protein MKW98_026210 [Papaver atlanticum]|uniref:Oxysterol-binding protein n=1 Tax=Papaver atlanticum TaxID=357466 RepID=A0AAD4T381_9MAGN|nr:hypothetical protein MKW98_026210 [Papaver atlanticum]
MRRVFSLFKNVRPGSDLTRFQFIAVVAWSISTTRPVIFGLAPFNPILGATHHVSNGTLNVLLEQVSHHPQVTALHATDEKRKLEMIWSQQIIPKFYGTSVEVVVHGKREMKLINHGENYVMNTPKLLIGFIPVPRTDWTGNVTIQCEESGLLAELCFTRKSFLGFGGSNRSVKGRIVDTSTKKTIYEVDGHWDSVVTIQDVMDKHETKAVIYNGKEALSKLKTPEVKDEKGLWTSESAVVWSEVSQSILKKDWAKAGEAKQEIREKERELVKERKSKGEDWVPKYFNISKANYSKEEVYECLPKQKLVPPAPIVCNTFL